LTGETIRPGNDGSGRETGKICGFRWNKAAGERGKAIPPGLSDKPVKTAEEALYGQ
jgi:hypothetical protein